MTRRLLSPPSPLPRTGPSPSGGGPFLWGGAAYRRWRRRLRGPGRRRGWGHAVEAGLLIASELRFCGFGRRLAALGGGLPRRVPCPGRHLSPSHAPASGPDAAGPYPLRAYSRDRLSPSDARPPACRRRPPTRISGADGRSRLLKMWRFRRCFMRGRGREPRSRGGPARERTLLISGIPPQRTPLRKATTVRPLLQCPLCLGIAWTAFAIGRPPRRPPCGIDFGERRCSGRTLW